MHRGNRELKRKLQAYPGPFSRKPSKSSATGWEISILGDLTDKEAELTEKLLEVPRRSRGVIYFDSCGGSVYVGLALATLIRLRGLDAYGVVTGECSSAALLPFAACSKRFVTAQSTLLFHPMRWRSDEDCRLEEAAEWTRHFKLLEEQVDQLLAQFLNLDSEKLKEWSRPGKFVSGDEFAAEGLAIQIDLFAGDLWSQITKNG
ncbi:MAG: ATP-dependent Clp protease proteolytic subunit [Planctomycetaceae bacterium]|nr:ATP-dependent Clp protease proteolytic subunit [Planctomycetaceae bacterium]